jgi:hypothetical protein
MLHQLQFRVICKARYSARAHDQNALEVKTLEMIKSQSVFNLPVRPDIYRSGTLYLFFLRFYA